MVVPERQKLASSPRSVPASRAFKICLQLQSRCAVATVKRLERVAPGGARITVRSHHQVPREDGQKGRWSHPDGNAEM